MALSLHDAVVPGFLQMPGAVAGPLDKAEAHCAGTGTDPAAIVALRLAPDMHDLAYQVKSTAVHSFGAIEGARRNGFSPDTRDEADLAGLRARIGAARAGLTAVAPGEVDALAERELVFSIGERFRVPFTVANFLPGFSTPNLHFHAAAAYALPRGAGVAVGKADYLGAMRTGYPA